MMDIRHMQIGHAVDFVIAYNERMKSAEKAEEQGGQRRKATQSDINAYFG